ncbi:immunoglobulin I-set domain protein [Ostertagia ostertagi]
MSKKAKTLNLSVTVTGSPEPKVVWFKDDVPIEVDNVHILTREEGRGHFTLTIKDSQVTDIGSYSCKATNIAGEARTEATVNVTKEAVAPQFVEVLRPIHVKESETLNLSVTVTGSPEPKVVWFKDDVPIEVDNVHILTREEGRGHFTLTIKDSQVTDIGSYSCKATNIAGEARTEATVNVTKEAVAPQFVEVLRPIHVKESETLNLSVTVTGSPEPKVVWFKDDVPIEVDNVHILTREEGRGHFTLTIKDSQVTDIGSYSCKATNIAGEARTEATVNVTKEAVAPQFVEVLRPIHVKESETLNLSVTVTGSPEPKVVWFKDDVPIEVDNVHILTREEGRGHFTLTIKDSQVTDIGSYSCKATNIAGEARTEATVNVTKEAVAPQFVEVLRPIHVKESETLNLSVTVTGSPEPKVVWFKDDVPIEVDNVHILTREEGRGHFTLTIKDSQVTDIGSYSCKATNIAGEARTEATVNVTKEAVAPQFVEVLRPIHVKESETLNLSVTVTGSPEPKVVWFKDDVPIEVDNVHILTREEGRGHFTLTIKDSQVTDIGSYSCKATNIAGEARTEATVNVTKEAVAPQFVEVLRPIHVKESETLNLSVTVTGSPEPKVVWFKDDVPIEVDNVHILTREEGRGHFTLTINGPLAPTFTKSLADQSISIGDQLVLFCSVKGAPQPTVEFYREGVRIKSSTRIAIEHDKTNTHWRVLIKQSTQEDFGKYRALAKNTVGSAISEATVSTKTDVPVFEQGLKRTSVKEKEEIRMEVKVSGTQPEVSWFKDGQPIQQDIIHEITQEASTGVYSLIVKEASMSDAGRYTVKATNIAGSVESSAEVEVTQSFEKPTFVKELVSTEVKVNETATLSVTVKEIKESESATLSVTVTGSPQPKVQWFKDDVPIQIDNVHLFAKEEGSYSCKATNEAGEARTEATVHVAKESIAPQFTEILRPIHKLAPKQQSNVAKESVAPQFVEVLRPIHVKESETLNLSVTVTGSPEPKVTWFKDDVPIQIDNVHVLSKDEGHGHFTLTVRDARVSDVGSYSCKATNEAGEAKTEAKMAVVEDLVLPHFTEGLKPLEVDEGKPAELTCTVVGKPEPEITWLKNGVPVQIDGSNVIRKDSEGQHTLIIKNLRTEDVGSYSCEAVNKAGKDVTIADLKIPKYGFEKPKVEEVQPLFIEPLKETVASQGETVVLECRVNTESQPEIQWYKDDKPIELSQHMVFETLDDGKIKLTIHNATKEDVGSYRCEAVNKVGKAETHANLQYAVTVQETVTDESEQLHEMVAETITTTETKAGRGPPEFVELLRSCTVTEKQQAVLRCKVKGEPRPKIKWTKEGKEVEMSARIKSEFKEDGTLTLTVDNVTQQDAGEYTGSRRRDSCARRKLSGKPKPTVKWYKNGENIKPTDRFVIDSLDDGTQRLTVKDTTMSDMGTKKPQEAPSFTKTLVEVAVVEGETATYECKVAGHPQPEIKWFKDKEEIAATDEHFIQTKEADGTARLVIKSTKVKDSGEIRCEARNPAVTARTDAPLTVSLPEEEIAPEFAQELTACQVMEGQLAKFECKVKAGPHPIIKWFKDGEELKPGDGVHIESLPDGTNRLTIDKTKIADQGNYRVEATNPAGSMSSKAPLAVQERRKSSAFLTTSINSKWRTARCRMLVHIVLFCQQKANQVESSCIVTVKEKAVKVQLPSFKKGLNDQAVPKGQPLVLEVEIEGTPKVVKWYKNGDELKNAKTEDLGNGKYRLTIPDFKESDVGDYSVTAENDVGEVESKAKVTVQEAPDDGKDKAKPEIVSGLIPTSVKQGETATFTVKVKGPVKGVKWYWYKNGKEIPDAKTKDKGDGTYELTIPDAKKDDAADYKVVVSNDAGEVDSAAALTVKTPQIEIVKGLEDTTIPQKQTGVLEIETSRPPKQVKWYKNGKEISPSDKAQPKKVGDNKYQLVIPDAGKDDSADYKVVLTDDDNNTAESSCALTVKLPGGIEIVKGLEDTTVPQKQTGVLEIETSRPPKAGYKNGKEISPSDKAQPKKVGDNKYQLVIPDAGKDDSADLQGTVVLTDDDNNTAESSCALTVKLPGGIEIVKGLEDTTVPQKQTGVLEIETSRPPKQVKWYKNGKEISPSDKAQPKKVGDNKYQLVIPDAGKDDSADYKVVLTDDDNNTAESSCALTVKLPGGIEIVKGLEDTTVPQKQTGVLEIETSRPPKQVKWYKNGKEISPSDKAQPKKVADNKYQLVIPDAGKDDTADYKVVLTDDDGNTAESSCALTVKLPSGIEIVKGLEDTTIPKKQTGVLEIETNRPPKQIKWYKNGKELTPSDKAQPKKVADNKYQLVIPDASKEDTADYKVVLTDDDDNTAESSCALTVKLPAGIEIVKGLEDATVPKGKKAVLEVESSRSPKQVKWYKNGKELTPSDKPEVKKVNDTKHQLVIPDASDEDTADYKVLFLGAINQCNPSRTGGVV